ncbi:MAG: hypothetical protein CMF24_00505, partial [Ilumatobacter sp.]|nr:hypothetical protein [Ilumatobacter sp.]
STPVETTRNAPLGSVRPGRSWFSNGIITDFVPRPQARAAFTRDHSPQWEFTVEISGIDKSYLDMSTWVSPSGIDCKHDPFRQSEPDQITN